MFNNTKKMRKKVIQNRFKEYYQSLSEEERVTIRDKFLEQSGIVYSSWYGKLQRNGFSKLELLALGKICNQNFINLI